MTKYRVQRLEATAVPAIVNRELAVLKRMFSLAAKGERLNGRRLPAVSTAGDKVTVTVPKDRNLVQSGWYMLFVDDDQGTPSKAVWVKVP